MSQERNDKESMICLTPKPNHKKKKNSEIIGISLRATSSSDYNPINYAIWGVLENKANATSHPNIRSLKTVIDDKWNEMFEEFSLKACKSFRRRVDKIIEKKKKKKRWPY